MDLPPSASSLLSSSLRHTHFHVHVRHHSCSIIASMMILLSMMSIIMIPLPANADGITQIIFPSGGLPTGGGSTISIIGSGLTSAGWYFGPTSDQYRYELTCTWTGSNQQCTSPVGSGSSSTCLWQSLGGSIKKDCGSYTFIPPTLSGPLVNLDTAGGQNVALSGTNFGPSGTSCVCKWGLAGNLWSFQSCTITVAHTTAVCQTAAGGGQNWPLYIVIDGVSNVVAQVMSYTAPTITGLTPKSIPTGGGIITLQGTQFLTSSSMGMIHTANIRGSPGTRTGTVSCSFGVQTQAECTLPTQIGYNYQMQLIVRPSTTIDPSATSSYQTMSAWSTVIFNYTAPVITSITPPWFNTLGTTTVTITGTNFGAWADVDSPVIMKGGASYPLTSCVITTLHTTLRCTVPQLTGTGWFIAFTVGGQQAVSPFTMGYATIDSVTITPAPPNLLNTDGTSTMTIYGTGFSGVTGVPLSYAVLSNGTSGVAIPLSCRVIFATQSVACNTSVGVGGNYQLQLRMDEGYYVTSTLTVSYQPPTITAINPTVNSISTTFTITGTNFGYGSGFTASVALINGEGNNGATYTGLICDIKSHTVIWCVMPFGVGVNFQVQVGIGGQLVTSVKPGQTISFAAPIITNVSSTNGGVTVSINGYNFGSPAIAVLVNGQGVGTANNVGLGTCTVVTSTSVTCVAGSGAGTLWQIQLTCGSQSVTSSTNQTFSFPPPTITSVSPSLPSTISTGVVITITGTNMGTLYLQSMYPRLATATLVNGGGVNGVSLNMSTCVIQSDMIVWCTVAAGLGTSYQVSLSVGGQTAVSSQSVSYSLPMINVGGIVTVLPMATTGGVSITVTGSNFGTAAIQSAAGSPSVCSGALADGLGIDGIDPLAVLVMTCNIQSDTRIICVTPAGVGYNHKLLLTVGGQSVLGTTPLSYQSPTITDITPTTSFATAGGSTVTITGNGFGSSTFDSVASLSLMNPSYNIPVSALATGTCTILSSTSIMCLVPPGVGNAWNVQLTVGGQSVNSTSISLSYVAPTLSLISTATTTMSTQGGEIITIQGTDMGPAILGSAAYIGFVTGLFVNGQGIDDITYNMTMTSCSIKSPLIVWCTSPVGVGYNHRIQLSFGGQLVSTNASTTISYTPPSVSLIVPNYGSRVTLTRVSLTVTNVGSPGSVWIDGVVKSGYYSYTWTSVASGVPPPTTGAALTADHSAITVIVGGQSSSPSLPFYYYDFDTFTVMIPVRGGWTVNVTGRGFAPNMDYSGAINIDNVVALSAQYVSPMLLTFTAPMANLDVAQRTSISVVTASLNGATQNYVYAGMITYYPVANITSIAPTQGPITGGTVITITGSFPDTGVIFAQIGNGTSSLYPPTGVMQLPCTRDTTAPTSTVTCTTVSQVAPSRGETISISVDANPNDRQYIAASSAFTYQAYVPPSIFTLSPPLAAYDGTVSVLIQANGDGFVAPQDPTLLRVMIGQTPSTMITIPTVGYAPIYNAVRFSLTTNILPTLTPGQYNVAISFNNQQYSESAANGVYLTVYAQPRLLSIYPLAFSTKGDDTITITGTGFLNSSLYVIEFFSASSPSYVIEAFIACTYLSPTQITFVTKAVVGVVTTSGIVAHGTLTMNGQQYTSATDNYVTVMVFGRPFITGVTPLSGPFRGGTNVTITGQWADTGYIRALFGSQLSPSCVYHSNSTLTCLAPSAIVAGNVIVRVSVDYPMAQLTRYYWSSGLVQFIYTNESIATVTRASVLSGVSPTTDDAVNANTQMDLTLTQPIVGLTASDAMIRLVNGTMVDDDDDSGMTLDYGTNVHGFQYYQDVAVSSTSSRFGSGGGSSLLRFALNTVIMMNQALLRTDCIDLRLRIRRALVDTAALTDDDDADANDGDEWMDVPYVMHGCGTVGQSAMIWYRLPPLLGTPNSTMMRLLYGDPGMTPADAALYTASYPARVFDEYDDFKTMKPALWSYQTDAHTSSFFNSSHGLIYLNDNVAAKYPTRRVLPISTTAVSSFTMVMTGERWFDGDAPITIADATAETDAVQPYMTIMYTDYPYQNIGPDNAQVWLLSRVPQAGCAAAMTSLPRRWWMMITVNAQGEFEMTSDLCDGVTGNLQMLQPMLYVYLGIQHSSATTKGTRRSSIDGFYMQTSPVSPIIVPASSSFGPQQKMVWMISATVPYQLVARANVVIQLSLNGHDWPLSYDVSTNNNNQHQVVTINIIDSSIMDHIIDITPVTAPFDSVISAGSITFDNTISSSLSLLSNGEMALRLSSLDQFMTLSPSSSGNNVYNWSFDGSIPSSFNMDNILGTHALQLQLASSQQIMPSASSSSSVVSFTKTALPRCPVSSAMAQDVYNTLQTNFMSIDVHRIIPVTDDITASLVLGKVQISQLWWPTEDGLVSSSCGSIPFSNGTSWLWGRHATQDYRILQSHYLDLRYAPMMVTFYVRFGLFDGHLDQCGLTKPIPSSVVSGAALELQWSNTRSMTWLTIATVLPTNDNDWHYYNITLPSWTQSDGGLLTQLRLYQNPTITGSVMAIQNVSVFSYTPSLPSFQVTSYSPSSAVRASGGEVITVIGSGFDSIGIVLVPFAAPITPRVRALMCSFGGRAARHVVHVNDTMVLCVTPSIAWTDASLTYETSFEVCGASFVGMTEAQKTISFLGCNIGTYVSSLDASCIECAMGRYSSSVNTINECHQCDAGRFSNITGETTPLCTDLCYAGYYCPLGSTSGSQYPCPVHSTSLRGAAALSDCICANGYSLSVTGAECSSCLSLIGFSSHDGYITCSGIRMIWGTLSDATNSAATATGRVVLTSLTNNIVRFNISGNIRVTSSSSSSGSGGSGSGTRRLLADTNGDEESDITNVNANDDSVAIMVRFGHAGTLSSQQSVATNNNTAIFTSLSICDTIKSVVDYPSWTTLVTCSLPYGISNNLSFSLWQYNNESVPILISFDGQVIVSGPTIADTFAYPAPVITDSTIRQATLPLSTRSTALLASSTTLSESIAFEGQFFDPKSMIVRYGLTGDTYDCIVDQQQSSSSMVVCNTPANLVGVSNNALIFSIQQGGYMVYGSDTYRYPIVPVVTRIWGCNGTSFSSSTTSTSSCPTTGGITITMCGTNWDNSALQAFVNGVECTNAYAFTANATSGNSSSSSQSISVLCPSLLTCVLPIGAGADQGVTVSSRGQFSPAAKLVSYSPPIITQLFGCRQNTSSSRDANNGVIGCHRFGGDRLTIIGENFGPASPSVLIGSASCTNLQWTNHSYVTCDMPSGSGNDRSVLLLQLNGDISSSIATISYQPCDAGEQPDGLNCTSCTPGYYSTSGVECVMCEPGKYAPNYGTAICDLVPPGTFQGGYGQSVAIVCDDGEQAPTDGLSQCLSCSAGKWSYGNMSVNKTSCSDCPIGTFSDGTRPCERCPELEFATQPASQSCSKCSGATYLLIHNLSSVDCLPCPPGVLCSDGVLQSNTQYYLAPQTDGSYRSLVCLPGLCRACNNSNINATLDHCCGDGRVQGNNPMCALCEDGLIEVGDGTKCQKCDASSGGLVFLFILVTYIFLFIFHRTSQSSGKTSDAQQFLYFIQMLIIFFGPESGWISWLSFINLNMLAAGGSSCVVPLSPLGRLLSGIVVPLIGLAELVFVFALDFCLWTWWNKKWRGYDHKYISWLLPKTRTFKSSPIRRTLVVYYLIAYTSIVTAVLQYFTCLTVSDTESVLQAYPAVSCHSSSYKSLNGLMWFICIAFVVISPLIMLAALIWNHIKGRLSQVKHTQRYGPLYEHFRASRYWWSFVTIIRRVVLITLVSQLGYDRPLMFSWVTFTNILMLLIHMVAQPYETVAGNNIETGLLTLHAIVTTLMTALPFPLSSKQAAGMSALIFIPTILFILYMILSRTHHIVRDQLSRLSAKHKLASQSQLSQLHSAADDSQSDSSHPVAAAGQLSSLPSSSSLDQLSSLSSATPSASTSQPVPLSSPLVPSSSSSSSSSSQPSPSSSTFDVELQPYHHHHHTHESRTTTINSTSNGMDHDNV